MAIQFLFPLALISKVSKVLYKILRRTILLWESQVLLSPYKGGGKRHGGLLLLCQVRPNILWSI